MSGIGVRLREERERLRLSQSNFGEIGGVKANAQGKYESGERFPDAEYLAALAAAGVDVLFVVTGMRTPQAVASISAEEAEIVGWFRVLPESDRAAVRRLTSALAASAGAE
jgi:transcriptional regulator with XRE-family HTH domain